jgi:hypothetical protein
MTIISSIALLSLMLAAFDGAKELPITVPTEAQAGDLVDLEPGTYEANRVEYDADCGTLVVLENRADPNSWLIALPVIRVRATGGNPAEPIFYIAGGLGKPTLPSILVSRWTSMRDLAGPGWQAPGRRCGTGSHPVVGVGLVDHPLGEAAQSQPGLDRQALSSGGG